MRAFLASMIFASSVSLSLPVPCLAGWDPVGDVQRAVSAPAAAIAAVIAPPAAAAAAIVAPVAAAVAAPVAAVTNPIIESTQKGIDQAQKDAANGRDATIAGSKQLVSTVGPAIDTALRDALSAIDQGMAWGDHHCGENPHNWGCPGTLPRAPLAYGSNKDADDLPPVVVEHVDGVKVFVVLQNNTGFPIHYDVWDRTAHAWIFSGTLAAWEPIIIDLLKDSSDQGGATVKRDGGLPVKHLFLRQKDVIN